MSWFEKIIPAIRTSSRSKSVPEGVWEKCPSCEAALYGAELRRCLFVCDQCGHHFRIGPRDRVSFFLDEGELAEIAADLVSEDFLKFKDTKKYKDRLAAAKKNTGEKDALLVVQGQLKGRPVVVAAFDFRFLGGSMGAVVGAKFVHAVNKSLELRAPLVCFSASGGARMQEALTSLLQMAKTAAAIAKLREQAVPFISVLTDPTMGGVSASLAMLGDVIVAEPNALIGFAGPRVIEQTVRQKLPEGFQRSDFLLKHGAVDMIVERKDLRGTIARVLDRLMANDVS